MRLIPGLLVAAVLVLPVAGLAQEFPLHRVDARHCAGLALVRNPQIVEAEAKVQEYRARLLEIENIIYPKLQATFTAAPMFTVEANFDSTYSDFANIDRRWQSIDDWGPSTRLDLRLIQPIYTFGRKESGERAAQHRLEVERARLRETENTVALEVQKLYYMYLYARSVTPTLEWANRELIKIRNKANEWYQAGNGKVTKADLAKIDFGDTELQWLRITARDGMRSTLDGLRLAMGLNSDDEFIVDVAKLPNVDGVTAESLPELLEAAARMRPEWAQVEHGLQATIALADAERLAMAPTAFFTAFMRHAWTPTRDEATNPYLNDPYNTLRGGLALGLNFDVDAGKAVARSKQAQAKADQLRALQTFASSGIPLDVRRRHMELMSAIEFQGRTDTGRRAARQWVTFASTAFMAGVGPARDVLDGMAAYLQATRRYYESIAEVHLAQAKLRYAVGDIAEPPQCQVEHGQPNKPTESE